MSSVINPKGVATTKKDKFLIGFNLDTPTQEILFNIHSEMCTKYPNLINNPTINIGTQLPYHMTIIGGIKINSDLSGEYMRGALEKLKPFQKDPLIPKLIDIEPAQLNDNVLGVRLKFEPETYVITGCPENNVALAEMLGIDTFDFNTCRHISICNVWNGRRGRDEVLLFFQKIISTYKLDLLKLKLTPCVWKDTKEGWREWIA